MADIRLGRPISGPEALLGNIEYFRFLNSAAGPRADLPGPIVGPVLAETKYERTNVWSRSARSEELGSSGPDCLG